MNGRVFSGSRVRSILATILFAIFSVAQGEPVTSLKKGVGLAENSGLGADQLQALGVSWYYNWGAQSSLQTPVAFVPMAFGGRTLPAQHSPVLLGFNEPDHPRQSHLSVTTALELWPQLRARARRLGAPAMAGDPVDGDWLPVFMRANPSVDFTTLHWYKGANAKRFKRDVQALCDRYGLPVWITEFAPATAAQARDNPQRHSQEEVNAFIDEVLPWLEHNSCVERYAWHDAKTGTSALWDSQGQLTETGRRYAATR